MPFLLRMLPGLLPFLSVAADGDLSAVHGWRIHPRAVVTEENASQLGPLTRGQTATWTTTGEARAWFALRFANALRHPVILTYSTAPAADALLEVSHNSADGRSGTWTIIDSIATGRFLNKIDIAPQQGFWYRIRFRTGPREKIKVWNLGLYGPRAGARNDYWLALGASIQNQSMRHARFAPLARRLYPQADPILFNLAVPGWGTGDLLRNLPAILERHPFSTYVLIHIGGNNISASRPYDGGAATLRSELTEILEAVRQAGKVPVLARISFRQYREPHPVPPDENGSGPYVREIIDPLIRAYCPQFYDFERGEGLVDFYGWFREHVEELSSDGVHLNALGELSWCRIWVEEAGRVVYGGGRSVGLLGRRVYSRAWDDRFRFVMRGGGPEGGRLRILDMRGGLLGEVSSSSRGSGDPVLEWSLRDGAGRRLPPGVYQYEVESAGRRLKGRIILTP